MAVLNIVKEGDPILRKTSRPVEEITPRILTLLDDMVETMHAAKGCGLAAVQVGVLRRLVVIEDEEGKLYELINPRIVARAGTQEESEGCLSIPGVYGITRRPKAVTVRALDRHGNEVEYTGKGLLARAFCHELDHLDGVLFTDGMIRRLGRDEVEVDE
ncbi:MAG: peptide deformylase [Clostridia bacterium]|jgi:peptide deformylase|nr:peptide deformylase [Clostridia bacterium]